MIENVTGRRLKMAQVSLEILSFILEHDGPTPAELDTMVDSSESPTCSHLNILLESRHLVRRDGVYHASFRVALLGECVRYRYSNDEVVKRVIDELADATGQEANSIIFEHDRLPVCYGPPTNEGRDTSGIRYRSEYHLHNTAAGKAVLSELDHDEVVLIVDHWGLPQEPEGTITNVDRLFDALGEIATQECIVADKEFMPNLITVGAPVHDGDGCIVGGLSVDGPKYQVGITRFEHEFVNGLLNVVEPLKAAFS